MIEPLRISFVVACPAEHAFAVWTSRTSSWWPIAHPVTCERGLEVVSEGRVGGRIFERTPAGVEVEWAEVTVWEPPRRLGYLWHIATDRADATDVEITFVARGDATTRVDKRTPAVVKRPPCAAGTEPPPAVRGPAAQRRWPAHARSGASRRR